jgi:hypothetical protein
MVIGDAAALNALGQKLIEAAQKSAVAVRPKLVATPPVNGPYTDIPFTLSFHLKGTAAPQAWYPHRRRTLWTPLFFLVAALAITRAVTAWSWILGQLGLGL